MEIMPVAVAFIEIDGKKVYIRKTKEVDKP